MEIVQLIVIALGGLGLGWLSRHPQDAPPEVRSTRRAAARVPDRGRTADDEAVWRDLVDRLRD